MLNEIVKGIAAALIDPNIFDAAYDVYQNDVKQGLCEPCFFIATLEPSKSDLMGRRALLRNPFDVHFIPKCGEGRNNAALNDMALKLLCALKYITLPNGDVLHGTDMSWHVEDDVLHFFVSYNLTVLFPAQPAELMNELDLEQSITKGE